MDKVHVEVYSVVYILVDKVDVEVYSVVYNFSG